MAKNDTDLLKNNNKKFLHNISFLALINNCS